MRIFKYFSIKDLESRDYALKLLKNGELFLSSIDKFNDPFEFSFKLEDEGKNEFWGSQQLAELSVLLPAIYQYGVCCFSDSPDNGLLWSHYANSHRGICIEFETTECAVLNKIKQVNYLDQCPTFTTEEREELFLNKSFHWKYEKEYRIVLKDCANKVVEINKPAIKAVYFGVKANSELALQVAVQAQESGLSLKKAGLTKADYTIDFAEYSFDHHAKSVALQKISSSLKGK